MLEDLTDTNQQITKSGNASEQVATRSMTDKVYKASLTKSQGRAGWSVIFRHPVRKDDATGKVGVRVRQGLSTRDEAEAQGLVSQLNELLADPRYHSPTARAAAEARFDGRVVDIFFYKMVPEET